MKKISTGERLDTFVHNETTLEHLHRYALACDLVKNKTVLDLACGEGYGSNLLAAYAQKIVGVDIDSSIIKQAEKKYRQSNLVFLEGGAEKIPCESNSIDVVISFETLEHVSGQDKMMKEFKRVLKPDGIILISTPDKKNYSDIPQFKNPFHKKEWYAEEFYQFMKLHFKNNIFLKQNFFFSSVIIPEGQASPVKLYEGDFQQVQAAVLRPLYHICVASDSVLPQLSSSLFFSSNTIDLAFKERMNKSIAYRTGNFILWPLKKIYALFRK